MYLHEARHEKNIRIYMLLLINALIYLSIHGNMLMLPNITTYICMCSCVGWLGNKYQILFIHILNM